MSTENEWGIDDAYLLAIGKINVAFQRVEEHLGYTVFLLMGGDRRIAQCVTSECSFDRLVHLILSLFKLRVEQFGDLHPELGDMLKVGLGKANQANVERNQIIHSQWGLDRDFNLVIEKIEAKTKHGLRAVRRDADSPADLLMIVERSKEADKALLDFCGLFAAAYYDAYKPGCGV